eukprot:scaffold14576_cov132-Isochrysis_galbana.AAC.12
MHACTLQLTSPDHRSSALWEPGCVAVLAAGGATAFGLPWVAWGCGWWHVSASCSADRHLDWCPLPLLQA